MNFARCLFITILVAVLHRPSAALHDRAPIRLDNNGYIGPLIGIHQDVPEDDALIDNIKTIFTDASQYLYVASREHAYFQYITILIPKSWQDKAEYVDATWETYDIANVIVADENPQWGHNPYTKQSLPCGEPAEYIHLTPFFINERDISTYIWGESGKVVVHEWGHLRWGLFDEYPTEEGENFYFDENGHTQPTRCSEAVTGKCYDINDNYRKCNKNPESGEMPDPGCTFFPDLDNNPGTSSYLFANYLESVTDFCHDDDSEDPNARHNKLANNQQNKLCGHKSSWEVMVDHSDFLPPNWPRQGIATAPQFKLAYVREKSVVLVLDISGSMTENDRLELLVQACTKYIRYILPLNSYLGLVEFSTNASVTYPLTQITSNEVREDAINHLPKVLGGRTCIGCGILASIGLLINSSQPTEGAILFLVSDGVQTQDPLIEDIHFQISVSNVTINTMSFSNDADGLLMTLSQGTAGQAYYFSESEKSTALHDGFTSSVVDSAISYHDVPVQILSTTTKVKENNYKTGSVHLDFSLGNNTIFYFYYRSFSTPTNDISVEVKSPSGEIYDEASDVFAFDETALIKTIEIPGIAEAGRWTYTVFNNGNAGQWTIEVALESVASSAKYGALKLTTSLSNPLIEESPPKIVIYAELRYGHTAVIGANVYAVVELPNTNEVTLPLLDNGGGADILKNDGVYSAYFVDFVDSASCGDPCRYDVTVMADDEFGSTAINTYSVGSGAMPTNFSYIPAKDTEPTAVGKFNRVASAGLIQLSENVTVEKDPPDEFAPSKITDLKDVSVMNSAYMDHVSLQWTATGDDFDQGTAFKYDLRYSTSFNDLLADFEGAVAVKGGDVVEGSLSSPQTAGSIEKITAAVPAPTTTNMTYYFAVLAEDEAGNRGDPSNIISVSATIVSQGEEYNPGLEAWVILVIAVSCAVAVAGATIAVVYFLKTKNKSKKSNKVKPVNDPEVHHTDQLSTIHE